MNLEINQMYYFKEIVESDFNLTVTAKKIHISQSALSQFIHQLEVSMGTLFFERRQNRLLGLTEVGKILYEEILKTLHQFEQMEEKVERAILTEGASVSFGAVTSYFQTLFPSFFIDMSNKYPQVKVDLIEAGAVEIEERFSQGEFDFALLGDPEGFGDDIKLSHLYSDEICAFVAEGHPLEKLEVVTWEDVAKYPLISLSDKFLTYYKIRERFKQYKLEPNFTFLSSSWQYLMESVKNTETITLLPMSTPRFTSNQTIITKRIENPAMMNIYLAERVNQNKGYGYKQFSKELSLYSKEMQNNAGRENAQ